MTGTRLDEKTPWAVGAERAGRHKGQLSGLLLAAAVVIAGVVVVALGFGRSGTTTAVGFGIIVVGAAWIVLQMVKHKGRRRPTTVAYRPAPAHRFQGEFLPKVALPEIADSDDPAEFYRLWTSSSGRQATAANYHLGCELRRRGDLGAAENALVAAADDGDRRYSAMALNELGELLEAKGEEQRAEACYREALISGNAAEQDRARQRLKPFDRKNLPREGNMVALLDGTIDQHTPDKRSRRDQGQYAIRINGDSPQLRRDVAAESDHLAVHTRERARPGTWYLRPVSRSLDAALAEKLAVLLRRRQLDATVELWHESDSGQRN